MPSDPLEIRTTPLLLTVGQDVARQTYTLFGDLGTAEELRRMTHAEFKTLLRQKLQAFGDEIMAAWEKLCGEQA